jgi:V8-like Glu-specific endopeptidase
MKTNLHFFYFALVFGSLLLFSNVFAQTAPLQYYIQSYQFESEIYNGDGSFNDNLVEIPIGVIESHNAPWIQLHFSEVNLGNESYIILKSLYDNKWQKLDAVSIEQWNNYSAFFNGSAVEINLFLSQTDFQVFLKIDEIVVGEWYNGIPNESICGPTDERVASDQPATARLLSIGCTAWIIPNGKFATAGHCLDGSNSTVVEFNVPISLPNGTLQHPGPEDQYSVNVSTKIFTNGGIGNDWGVFEVYPNSITGMMPKEVQNAYWPLVQDFGADSIRVTGYGVDGPAPGFGNGTRDSTNQTQQTHVGPNAGSSGTTMRYVTDTQGGNSGSPVIDALTNNAVGVHTHGGCSTSGGNNNGTSTFHTAFWAAVDEGAIPVELTSFSANMIKDRVELKWRTSTEVNNQGFEIERMIPGGNFEKIGYVAGFGTTTEPKVYSFIDTRVEIRTYSYRLKQIDFDGTFEYSDVVEVDIPVPAVYALEQNYPNPFNPSTKIKFSIPEETDVRLSVYNSLGQEVAQILNSRLKEGYHEVNFEAVSLTSGIYFYRLEADKFIDVKKMIIIK